MEKREERLFRAMGGVGSDLIDTAEKKQFPKPVWRRALPVAACAAVLLTGAVLLAPKIMQQPQVYPTSRPGQEETLPQTEEKPAPEPEKEAREPARDVQPRERLTAFDTIYYVESLYTPEQAEPLMRESFGQVQWADRPELQDWRVYPKKNCTWKGGIPMEIFVSCDEGYLYCLTYFASAKPIHEVLPPERWPGQLEGMQLSAGLLDLTFGSPSELNADQLLDVFNLTMALEEAAGVRSEDLNRYLWYAPELNALAVPLADLQRQLDRYLEGYTLHPEDSAAYDRTLEAFVLPVEPEGKQVTVDQVEVTDVDGAGTQKDILVTLRTAEGVTDYVLTPMENRTLIREIAAVLPEEGE